MIQLINIPDKCKRGGERLSAKKHRKLKEENLASFANLCVQMAPVITTSAKPITTPKGFLVVGEASKPANAEFRFLLYQLSRISHLRGRNPRLLKGEAGLYQSCFRKRRTDVATLGGALGGWDPEAKSLPGVGFHAYCIPWLMELKRLTGVVKRAGYNKGTSS